MEFKVRHSDFDEVRKTIDRDQEDLDKEIETMLKTVARLRTIWQGGDATNFCNNFEAYAQKMKNVNVVFGNFSKFMDSANKGYKESDVALNKALEAEAAKYEG